MEKKSSYINKPLGIFLLIIGLSIIIYYSLAQYDELYRLFTILKDFGIPMVIGSFFFCLGIILIKETRISLIKTKFFMIYGVIVTFLALSMIIITYAIGGLMPLHNIINVPILFIGLGMIIIP